MHRSLVAAALWLAFSCSSDDRAADREAVDAGAGEHCDSEPTELYAERIEPLLSEDNPKTCNQCHLSGVDLSIFARDTPCETMACLVSEGLVNLEAPMQSKILNWIERASPESELITEAVIAAEYDGFLQWIQASAACRSACAGVTCGAPGGSQSCAVAKAPTGAPVDTEGCSDAALEQLFYDNVYAFRGRCSPCHFSNQPTADPAAPRWLRADGNCATASLETMRRVIASGYLDLEEPAQSLLLLKPLAEAAGGVEHGGHDKFANTNEPAYRGFLHFIERYASCKGGG